jgi:hypothetical protein
MPQCLLTFAQHATARNRKRRRIVGRLHEEIANAVT